MSDNTFGSWKYHPNKKASTQYILFVITANFDDDDDDGEELDEVPHLPKEEALKLKIEGKQ